MIRTVALLQFLPTYLQEYEELQQISTVETPEVQALVEETETVKNNQFITICDEVGISRWEELLDIVPAVEDSLETRIFRVLVRWNDCTPYTYPVLVQRLDAMLGEGNYVMKPEFSNYLLGLELQLTELWQITEVIAFLYYFLPANILLKSENVVTTSLANCALGAVAVLGGVYSSTTLPYGKGVN